MAETYDLDAAKAAQREALREPFQFVFEGEKFQFPPSDDWPVRISSYLAEGNIQAAVVALLRIAGGADAPERFLAHNPTMGHIKLLMEEAARLEAMDLPNSSSPPSSDSIPM